MPKTEITPEHFQFYHQILNGVSGFIIYHFAYELVDTNLLEDNNEDEDIEITSSGKRPCTSKSQCPSPKKLKHSISC